MTRIPQRAFSGGIMSPGMYSRIDIPKNRQGVKDAVNMLIRAEGGMDSRAGTLVASGYDTSTVDGYQWLVPFEAAENDTYMLEFGDAVMRVIKSGAYVLDSAFTSAPVTVITQANPSQLLMDSAATAATLTVGRLYQYTDPNGTSPLHSAIIKVTAITSDAVDFTVVDGTTLDNTGGSDPWGGGLGAGSALAEIYETTSPFAIEDMPDVQVVQDVDTMFFAHNSYDPQKLVRNGADDDWTFSTITFAPTIGQVVDAADTIIAATQANPCVITTSPDHGFAENQLMTITGVVGMTELNGNTYRATNITASTFELATIGGAAVDSTAFTAYISDGTASHLGAAEHTGSGSTTYKYKAAAVDGETGEVGLPSAEVTTTNDLLTSGNKNIVFWEPVAGATAYHIYKDFNGIYGFIGITQGIEFEDENITPDTADNPQSGRDPFATANDRPAVVSFVEQRLTFADTVNNPQLVEMSTSVTPLNFNRALTPGASDAITFRMKSQKLNRVEHIVDMEAPIILTAGAEWFIATQEEAAMATGNFSLRPASYRGSASKPSPVLVGELLLHVSRDGNTLREFSLKANRDTPSADLTILVRHLFRGKTITSMAYAQAPDSVIWVTLATGECYSLTYLTEHEVWGWTRHSFGGTGALARQVAVINEGAYDTPYFVVTRTVNGQSVTLTERLDTREFTSVEECYFVDAGIKYNGAAVTALRGFIHLRNEPVSVLADGSVLENITVDEYGQIDLGGESATELMVGLGYDAYLVTLPGDFGDNIQDLGSSLGRFKSTDEVAVAIVETRGIAVGLEGGTLNEHKQFTGDEPIPLETGTITVDIDGDWSVDQSIEVRQVYPLPMSITAIAGTWTLGE